MSYQVLATLNIADLFRDRRMMIPTQMDFRKIGFVLRGAWPVPHPPSAVVGGPPHEAAAPTVEAWVNGCLAQKRRKPFVVIDTEYQRASRALDLIGLGYRHENGEAHVLQIKWPALTAGEKLYVAEHLKRLIAGVRVVYQNQMADVPVLKQAAGITYADHSGGVEDTMLSHAVLFSDWPHDLEFLGSLYSPYEKAKHLAREDPLRYNVGDVLDTIAVWEHLEKELTGAPRLMNIYRGQSMALAPMVIEAHERGIRVNKDRVMAGLAEYTARLDYARDVARQYAGIRDFNIGAEKQMKEMIYAVEGMPEQRKKPKGAEAKGKGKGAITIDADAVAVLRGLIDPIPDLDMEAKEGMSIAYVDARIEAGAHPLLEARALYMAAQQARSHYIIPCLVTGGSKSKPIILGPKERIYPQFALHAQATGRWSTTDPPLAQLPADLRDIIMPDEGWCWIAWDWKNIERRLLMAETNSRKLKEIFDNDWDMHTLTMCDVLGLPYPPNRVKADHADNAEWHKLIRWGGKEDPRRTFAKRFGFRLDYGGDPKYATDIPGVKTLGIDPSGLVSAAERYFNADPDYKRWRKTIVAKSLAQGFVEAFDGRRRMLYGTPDANARVSMNTPMQAGVSSVFNTVAAEIYASDLAVQWVFGMHDAQTWACRAEDADRIEPALLLIAQREFTIQGRKHRFPADLKERVYG